ncbi:MAG TPA: BrnT family toxin [Verrucomicrobiota bacterium]|nr:BrnT family toxin [Verrucomicrobiota bacterium]
MKFEWDEHKNRLNIRGHGIDFDDAKEIFYSRVIVEIDDRHDYGELRLIGIGVLKDRVISVVFTEPEPGIIRLISARKAVKHERKKYEE